MSHGFLCWRGCLRGACEIASFPLHFSSPFMCMRVYASMYSCTYTPCILESNSVLTRHSQCAATRHSHSRRILGSHEAHMTHTQAWYMTHPHRIRYTSDTSDTQHIFPVTHSIWHSHDSWHSRHVTHSRLATREALIQVALPDLFTRWSVRATNHSGTFFRPAPPPVPRRCRVMLLCCVSCVKCLQYQNNFMRFVIFSLSCMLLNPFHTCSSTILIRFNISLLSRKRLPLFFWSKKVLGFKLSSYT